MYVFLSCTPIAKKSFDYSSELASLSRLDLLPTFRSNCIVEQISSYDRTGGNDDGFNGTYSYIRRKVAPEKWKTVIRHPIKKL